jgi:hypothetical protein
VIDHNPLHGSGRAGFPHPALALGDHAHAPPQSIGMIERRQRHTVGDETPHAVAKNAVVLAAPRQRAMTEPADSEPKNRQRRLIHGHSVAADVSTYNRRLMRLNTRPAPSPVNAWTRLLRVAPHDSGPTRSLIQVRVTFACTTPRRFNRHTGET